MVASVIDSPSTGTLISVAIPLSSFSLSALG
jgi:hypothetical protein